MAKKGLFGSKGPLIYATVVSLICVMSASISTFAWFQAEANVQIKTKSASTTITVSNNAGTAYNFYAYNGNGITGYSNKNVFHDSTDEADGDFTLITDSNKTSLTNTSDLFPGESALFAIELTGLSASTYSLDLSLKSASSQTVASKTSNAKHRYARSAIGDSDVEVNIAWAMDVVACGSNSADYYHSSPVFGSDSFEYGFSHSAKGTSVSSYIDGGKSMYSNGSASPSSGNFYIFYKLVFSNESSTWYTEKESNYSTSPEYPLVSRNTRYFLLDTDNGNSNCFAGLSFQMTELGLNITEA